MGIGNHQDRGVHIGMEVAKHLNRTGLIKSHRPGLPSRIVAQIERFRLRKGEDVVKDGVAIRKRHGRANRDHEHFTLKPPIPLRDLQQRRGPWMRQVRVDVDHRASPFVKFIRSNGGRGCASPGGIDVHHNALFRQGAGDQHAPLYVARPARKGDEGQR